MKNTAKKTKEVKEVKNVASIATDLGELSILEEAKLEKNLGKGLGKPKTKEVFKMWLVLPDVFRGMPERITELLGISDKMTLALLSIKTMDAFAEEFSIHAPTLSLWRKELENNSEFFMSVKKEFRKLTKNLIAAMYRKAIEEGDAARFTAWMKIVEDWKEQFGMEHSGSVGDGLSPEEKKALDDLLAKNTK